MEKGRLTPEAEAVVLQDYCDDGGGKAPRYYQVNAISAAIEAIAKGGDRILLVMATGTGKTYTTRRRHGFDALRPGARLGTTLAARGLSAAARCRHDGRCWRQRDRCPAR